jgi:hypothetical protein
MSGLMMLPPEDCKLIADSLRAESIGLGALLAALDDRDIRLPADSEVAQRRVALEALADRLAQAFDPINPPPLSPAERSLIAGTLEGAIAEQQERLDRLEAIGRHPDVGQLERTQLHRLKAIQSWPILGGIEPAPRLNLRRYLSDEGIAEVLAGPRIRQEHRPLGDNTFVGRERELRWLEDRVSFTGGWHAPVFVVGVGGVGKTTLVNQWLASRAHRVRSWDNLTPRWLDLSSVPNAAAALAGFVNTLYDETSSEQWRRQELIVVIDGAETLSDQQLENAIGRLFNLKRVRSIVSTSRRRPSVERAEVLTLPGLEASDTERMLRMLAQRALSPADIEAAVKATHGVPLAVSLLARLQGLGDAATVSEFLARPLYEVPGTIVVPQSGIIPAVAPRIVSATEAIVEELKKRPESVHDLSPRKFEELLAELLTNMGWRVELTPATRDGGKDLLAYLDTDVGEILCLVEAKKHRRDRKVGVDLVRSLYGTLCDYEANSAMLVTTSSFSPDAHEFQKKHRYQLSLRDYGNIVDWIQQYRKR